MHRCVFAGNAGTSLVAVDGLANVVGTKFFDGGSRSVAVCAGSSFEDCDFVGRLADEIIDSESVRTVNCREGVAPDSVRPLLLADNGVVAWAMGRASAGLAQLKGKVAELPDIIASRIAELPDIIAQKTKERRAAGTRGKHPQPPDTSRIGAHTFPVKVIGALAKGSLVATTGNNAPTQDGQKAAPVVLKGGHAATSSGQAPPTEGAQVPKNGRWVADTRGEVKRVNRTGAKLATPVSYIFVEPEPLPPGNTPGNWSMLQPENPDFSNVVMLGYVVVIVLLLVALGLFFKSAAGMQTQEVENNSLMAEENNEQGEVDLRNVLAE
jgi:hypothetical protein